MDNIKILEKYIEDYEKATREQAHTYFADGNISGYTIWFVNWLIDQMEKV